MPEQSWTTASDGELLDACRDGRTDAFSIVWERHRRAAYVAARGIAPGLDADDLVSESYLRILDLVADGRGPRGAFRPYLYRVIKSVAADQLRRPEYASADLDQIPDLAEAGPWEDDAFDLNAVAQAFSTLNERWQAALWYTEVEGMPPREAAALLGVSANSVSALAGRARDALRSAWVAAHANREQAEAECRSTLEHLQRYQRGRLTARASREVAAHLEHCERCADAAAESLDLNRQLGLVLGGALLGGAGAAGLLDAISRAHGGEAGAVQAAQAQAAQASAGQAGVSLGAASAGGGLAMPAAILSGAVAASLAIAGGIALIL